MSALVRGGSSGFFKTEKTAVRHGLAQCGPPSEWELQWIPA